MLSYSIGDTWSDYECTAYDNQDGVIDCNVIGTVDTSTIGEYSIQFYAVDSSNNETSIEVTYVVMRDATLLSMDMDSYYDDAEGLYGEALIEALRTILQTTVTMQTYGDARYILDETDQDPNNPNNVILVYRGTSVSGVWDGGITWNREHVWPQSLLGVETENHHTHVGADLHNLKPANPSENTSRGNKYFDYITTTVSYAPRDEVKGDIARILFYMIIMYDYLSLVNEQPDTYQMALLDVMLEWMYLDEVDSFEENRNDVIYFYQGNRNPFIDYPHLVELIWWDYPFLIDHLDSLAP